jgi:NAD-dependent dihydropyrimidine dehydrogenase PreA subunit/nitroreductase
MAAVAKTITVDSNVCKKDGLCAMVCPARMFSWSKGNVPALVDEDRCVLCGQCVAVCPSGAIAHSRLEAAGFSRIQDHKPVAPEAFMAFLAQRRSVRVYKKDPVPRELLDRIVSSVGLAPVGAFGGPGWVRRAVVVTGETAMAKVRDLTSEYIRELGSVLEGFMVKTVAKFVAEARGGLATLPDIRMRLSEISAGRDSITYDAPAAVFLYSPEDTSTPQQDCDAAVMYILMAAHAFGLGACWNGYLQHAAAGDHVKGFTKLRELLGIPKGFKVYGALTLGWPVARLHSVPPRKTEIRWIE